MSKGTCKFEGCAGNAVGKGYCSRHYKRWREGALPKGRYKICTAEGCRKPRANGSKCEEHSKAKAASAEPVAAPAAAE
jgi:hypothetical protein